MRSTSYDHIPTYTLASAESPRYRVVRKVARGPPLVQLMPITEIYEKYSIKLNSLTQEIKPVMKVKSKKKLVLCPKLRIKKVAEKHLSIDHSSILDITGNYNYSQVRWF